MATTTSINPYQAHDSTVSLYQVPEFVVDGEKMLFHALYGNEAYEKLRKLASISSSFLLFGDSFEVGSSTSPRLSSFFSLLLALIPTYFQAGKARFLLGQLSSFLSLSERQR